MAVSTCPGGEQCQSQNVARPGQCSAECLFLCFFFQAEDGIRDLTVTGVQTCALPILALVLGKNAFAQESSGYGPPVSVSVTRSTIGRAELPPRNLVDQTQAEADRKSVGCLQCHQGVEPMHKAEQNVVLGCVDCHGGNSARHLTKEQAHILPKHKEFWNSSANPPNSNTWLNHESPEFIRFINPGDLRVAQQSCGVCHGES